MIQSTVLLISDDSDFSQTVIARWQTERNVPSFVTSTTEPWAIANASGYDMVILGSMSEDKAAGILTELNLEQSPVLYIANSNAQGLALKSRHPRVMVLNDYEGWVSAAVLLSSEAIRRIEALARARRAEQAVASARKHAMLGRYMLDMRHSLNNALTSILGNAELILLEPGAISAQTREQMETIHNMSLRVHEIIQRFTSLEAEMQFEEQAASHVEMAGLSYSASRH